MCYAHLAMMPNIDGTCGYFCFNLPCRQCVDRATVVHACCDCKLLHQGQASLHNFYPIPKMCSNNTKSGGDNNMRMSYLQMWIPHLVASQMHLGYVAVQDRRVWRCKLLQCSLTFLHSADSCLFCQARLHSALLHQTIT